MYRYKAKLHRVVDGDTVYLNVDLGFHITTLQSFRLLGIDTPEIRGEEREAGLRAKEEVITLLNLGEIEIESQKTGKYGRWLATIYVRPINRTASEEEWINVNQYLLENGFATVYQ